MQKVKTIQQPRLKIKFRLGAFFIAVVPFLSCDNHEKSHEISNSGETKVDSNKSKILTNGDTMAYKEMTPKTFQADEEYFFYSVVMAEVYNHIPSYERIYLSAMDVFDAHAASFDSAMVNFISAYLLKAIDENAPNSQLHLDNLLARESFSYNQIDLSKISFDVGIASDRELMDNILRYGDTTSYNILMSKNFEGSPEKMFFYSLVLALSQNYDRACNGLVQSVELIYGSYSLQSPEQIISLTEKICGGNN